MVNLAVNVLKWNLNRKEDTASDPQRQMRKNHFSKSRIIKQLWYKMFKVFFSQLLQSYL